MKKLVASSIRVAELDAFSDVVVRAFKADSAVQGDEDCKAIVGEIESISASLTTALKSEKSVSRLDEVDAERDAAIRSLAILLEGYTEIPFDDKKAAAKKAFSVFSKYGRSLVEKNLKEESALVESLLEDFSRLKAETALLDGVDILVARVRAAEDAFSECYDEHLRAKASEKDVQSATSLRKPLIFAINERLIPFLDTMRKIRAATFEKFASLVEAEVERTNALVASRKRGQGKAES